MIKQLSLNFPEIYTFTTGRDEIVTRIENSHSQPRIIAVFGIPDSGKTYLIDFIGDYFEFRGFKTRQRNNPEKINLYESWAVYLYNDTHEIEKELHTHDIILYHCPWDNREKPWKHHTDPEVLLKSIGKRLDISVGIFNPKRSGLPIGTFDIVISNPASYEKPLPYD